MDSKKVCVKILGGVNSVKPPKLEVYSAEYKIGNRTVSISFVNEFMEKIESFVINGSVILDLSKECDRVNYDNLVAVKATPYYGQIVFDELALTDEDIMRIDEEKATYKLKVYGYDAAMLKMFSMELKLPATDNVSKMKMAVVEQIDKDFDSFKKVASLDDLEYRYMFERGIAEGVIEFKDGNYQFKGSIHTFPLGNSKEACVAVLKNDDNANLVEDLKKRINGFNHNKVDIVDSDLSPKSKREITDFTMVLTKGIKVGLVTTEDSNGVLVYKYGASLLGEKKDAESFLKKNKRVVDDIMNYKE